jgi:hypothetical protein
MSFAADYLAEEAVVLAEPCGCCSTSVAIRAWL